MPGEVPLLHTAKIQLAVAVEIAGCDRWWGLNRRPTAL
jgi:hypothetical protein